MPARLDPPALDEAARVAVAAHRELGLRDWSRADLIVDDRGTVTVLELCAAPGMTETSLFPQAAAADGLELGAVTEALVAQALARS